MTQPRSPDKTEDWHDRCHKSSIVPVFIALGPEGRNVRTRHQGEYHLPFWTELLMLHIVRRLLVVVVA